MAEQAQSDADDLDGLQEVPLDATQDPTDPSTKAPYAKLIQELKEPDTPPQGRQINAASPTRTRQAAPKSVKRHPNSIREPNRPNVAGLQATKRPTRLGGPRRPIHQPPPPKPHPRLGKRNCSHVRPSWTPPTPSNKEKVGSLLGNK